MRHATALLVTLLTYAPLPAVAQSDAPLTLSTTCLGAHRLIPLEAVDGGFLDLGGAVSSLSFGDRVSLCIEADRVVVDDGPDSTAYPCDAIRDSPDEGLGHAFTSGGAGYELWFYINPAGNPPALEIGLSRAETELVWIETGLAICAR
ncbi:hypothetical protein [Sagittula sp. S175]|uniref:hypothetical protein n=1 Tax=Sagittula sp. S175 TaxID=3415129 RepID=UPI003C7EC14E